MKTSNRQSSGWYDIKASGKNHAELNIYGDIGESWYAEESNTAKGLVEKLEALGAVEYLTVGINSYGGSVADGLAIYNALKRHPAAVTVRIDGVAVSIASLIAMAGDTIEMPENTLFMVHAPWGGQFGNAKEMREMADVLDKYSEAMAASYVAKTGKTKEEILGLLTDGEDHWFTAEEALAYGFADVVTQALPVAASLRTGRFSIPAAMAATQTGDTSMGHSVTSPAAPNEPQGLTEQEIQAKHTAALKARNAEIREIFADHQSKAGVQDLLTDVLSDPEIDVAAAGKRLLAHLGKTSAPATPAGHTPRIDAGVDDSDKIRAAATDALMVRAGVADQAVRARVDASNPYRGYRLRDLARDCVERAGIRTRGMDEMAIVAAAFTQSTSDFPVLLEDAMHKTVQTAYATADDTWSRFCAVGSVTDFRDHNRYRFGSLGSLDVVPELGEVPSKALPDGEKGVIAAQTRSGIVSVSRQMIVNDDLGAFMGLAAMLGRSARRTIEEAVYALLNLNGGLGPTQGDGQPLFHSNRSNVGADAANSTSQWDAMRVIMAQQKDVSGKDYLDLRPAVWVGPIGLGGLARQVNEAEYDDEATKQQRRPNISRGLVRDIVDSPRFADAARYYLFADPNVAPVIEVAFLNGNQMPQIENDSPLTVHGTQYRVTLDFGVAAVDWRGAVTAKP